MAIWDLKWSPSHLNKTESDHFVFSKLALQGFVSEWNFFCSIYIKGFKGQLLLKLSVCYLFYFNQWQHRKALLEDFLKSFSLNRIRFSFIFYIFLHALKVKKVLCFKVGHRILHKPSQRTLSFFFNVRNVEAESAALAYKTPVFHTLY